MLDTAIMNSINHRCVRLCSGVCWSDRLVADKAVYMDNQGLS